MLFCSDDPGGAWSAGDVFGWLVLAGHGINYDCDEPEQVTVLNGSLVDCPRCLNHLITSSVTISRVENR